MKNTHTKLSRYEQMGMAALIPGMQYLIERMQAEVDELKSRLGAAQGAPASTDDVMASIEEFEAEVAKTVEPKPKRKLTPKQLRQMRKAAAAARAAMAAKRLAAGKKRAAPWKGHVLPLQVEGWFTKPGAMKELNLAKSSVERLMAVGELRFKAAQHFGRRLSLIDPASVAAAKNARNGAAA